MIYLSGLVSKVAFLEIFGYIALLTICGIYSFLGIYID